MREYPVHLTIPVRGSLTDGLQELIARGEHAQYEVNAKLTKGERLMNGKLVQRVELSPHEAFGGNLERSREVGFGRLADALDAHLTNTPCARCEHCIQHYETQQLPHSMTIGLMLTRECTQKHTPDRVCPDGFFPLESVWAHKSLPSEFEVHSKYGNGGPQELSLMLFRQEIEEFSPTASTMFGADDHLSVRVMRRSISDFPKGIAPSGDYGRQYDPEYLDENEVRMLSDQVAAMVSAEEQRKREAAAPQTPTEDAW